MHVHLSSTLLIIYFVSALHWTQGREYNHQETFTTYANLLKLYYIEQECLSTVDVFLREELAQHGDMETADAAHNLTSLRRLVEETKEVHREVGGKVEDYLANPVNAYRLARRLSPGWRDAIKVIRKSKACREWHLPHVLSRLGNMEDNLPTDEQLRSLGYTLVTIQHTQATPTADIIAGRIGGHVAHSPLSPEEQFHIAKLAVDEDDYFYAAQWLEHLASSGDLSRFSRHQHGFNATNVLGMLASAYFRINMVPEAMKRTEELLEKEPGNVVAQTNRQYFQDYIARKGSASSSSSHQHPARHVHEDAYWRNYEALCRGTRARNNKNKCRLVPTRAKLSFYKMEVLRKKPPILAFHDVLSASDTDNLIGISETEFEKAAVDDDFRTPAFTLVLSSVMNKQQGQLLSKLKRKFLDLPYTVVPPYVIGEGETRNFGFQGLYVKPAPDFEVDNLGGHTASYIAFLNDVEKGGEIVFPMANARLKPTKGTVLFYFPSLKKFHTICPVAYGTEWLALQSFYERPARTMCRMHEDPALKSH